MGGFYRWKEWLLSLRAIDRNSSPVVDTHCSRYCYHTEKRWSLPWKIYFWAIWEEVRVKHKKAMKGLTIFEDFWFNTQQPYYTSKQCTSRPHDKFCVCVCTMSSSAVWWIMLRNGIFTEIKKRISNRRGFLIVPNFVLQVLINTFGVLHHKGTDKIYQEG